METERFKELKKIIKESVVGGYSDFTVEDGYDFDQMIDKQIQQEPINEHCASCKADVRNWTGDDPFAFCPECGQAIDWGDNNG